MGIDLYFTNFINFSIIRISQLYITQIVVDSIIACDQALTIRGSFFTNCVHNLKISDIWKYTLYGTIQTVYTCTCTCIWSLTDRTQLKTFRRSCVFSRYVNITENVSLKLFSSSLESKPHPLGTSSTPSLNNNYKSYNYS